MGYHTFEIKKKSGGTRIITAPDDELKKKQKTILKQLEKTFWISKHAHGFKRKKNIVTNATVHIGKKWILNMDIKDFFPSINLKTIIRININEKSSKTRQCVIPEQQCLLHEGVLPQGAPTSPFLSNFVMREFDIQIIGLVRKYVSDDIAYSRYGDDLTFSSNSHALEKVEDFVCNKLKSIGFKLNEKKTRMAGKGQRQEVTGININSGKPTISKKYRKNVRAMVHRAVNGWIITEKQKQRLIGMISHIALCHKEEAKKYRELLLPVQAVKNNYRKHYGVANIYLNAKQENKTNEEIIKQENCIITGKSRVFKEVLC